MNDRDFMRYSRQILLGDIAHSRQILLGDIAISPLKASNSCSRVMS
ncbi:hypothetical protein LTSEWAN_2341 [Salmonella enterica subsp. enterica serovar Wandsworth str. A4-580]|uniref:Uncharacterized protein n=1 Tax=Salmonella enterica subsp. enterica serovar Wandsworth str. A4-580 TaxID=913086 RepID=G5SB43_SALET|nr:hypothetical protein LTSEWAN_2341 [Salmonella enterica subsp. enterica serovar Wandsworth str. A4-580]